MTWPCAVAGWELIDRLHEYYDVTPSDQLHKLYEECGEVAAAYIGLTGTNPRKGVTHTLDDVVDELLDVIVTAMVALNHFSVDPEAEFLRAMSDRGKYKQRLSVREEGS